MLIVTQVYCFVFYVLGIPISIGICGLGPSDTQGFLGLKPKPITPTQNLQMADCPKLDFPFFGVDSGGAHRDFESVFSQNI